MNRSRRPRACALCVDISRHILWTKGSCELRAITAPALPSGIHLIDCLSFCCAFCSLASKVGTCAAVVRWKGTVGAAKDTLWAHIATFLFCFCCCQPQVAQGTCEKHVVTSSRNNDEKGYARLIVLVYGMCFLPIGQGTFFVLQSTDNCLSHLARVVLCRFHLCRCRARSSVLMICRIQKLLEYSSLCVCLSASAPTCLEETCFFFRSAAQYSKLTCKVLNETSISSVSRFPSWCLQKKNVVAWIPAGREPRGNFANTSQFSRFPGPGGTQLTRP